MFHFECLTCGKAIKTRPELVGKKVKCPKCGTVVRVPAEAASPVPAGGSAIQDDLPEEKTRAPIESPPKMSLTDAPTAPPADARTKAPVAKDETFQAGKQNATQDHDGEDDQSLTDFLAPAQEPDEIGRLGPYRVLKILGRGGMGMVFQAEDPQLERKLALKVMLPALAASASAKKRFLREAKTAAAIEHDHIVPIFQVGEDNGVPYIAMPFLQGEPLDDRIKREPPLPMSEILRIGAEIAQGLAAAHGRGLIHRDIKPANVWLEASPGRKSGESRVKILDFGLARAASDVAHLTQSGAIIGTPAFMAPEQATGKPVDHRCDLFSLGCVLYRMCTGQMPFKGGDTIQILSALALEDPPPPDSLNADVPAELSDLVMELLAKKPEERPETAEAVVERLEAILQEQTAVAPGKTRTAVPGRRTGVRKRSKNLTGLDIQVPGRKRSRWLWPVVAAAVALVAVGVGAFVWHSPKTEPGNEAKLPVPTGQPVAQSPFLDSAQIPPVERYDGQPKELVAVLGEFRSREQQVRLDTPNRMYGVFSPTGKLVATCSSTMGFRIWDAETLRPTGVGGEELKISTVVFAPKDKILVVGDTSGSIHSWDLSKEKPDKTAVLLTGHQGPVLSLAFSSDGKTLASGGQDGSVRLWDWSSAQPRQTALAKHDQYVIQLAFTPDGKTLATTCDDGIVRLWNVAVQELTLLAVSKKHEPLGGVGSVAIAPNGKMLAAHYFFGRVVLCDLTAPGAELQERHVFEGKRGWHTSTAFSTDSKTLAYYTAQEDVQLVDLSQATPRLGPVLKGLGQPGHSLTFAPVGKKLLTIDQLGILRLWDLSAKEPKELAVPATGHRGLVTALAFSLDSKTLASGGFDRTVRTWDLTGPAPKEQHVLGDHKEQIYWLKVSQDNKSVFAAAGDELVHWDLTKTKPKRIVRFAGREQVIMADFDANEQLTLLVTHNLHLFKFSGKVPKEWPLPYPPLAFGGGTYSAVLAPDGKTMAFQTQGTTQSPGQWRTWLMDVSGETAKARAELAGEWNFLIRSYPFSPDGKLLVTAPGKVGGEGLKITELHLWDLTQAQPKDPYIWKGHVKNINSAVFAPDGKTLFSGDEGGNVLVWNVASGQKTLEWQVPSPVRYMAVSPDGVYLAVGTDSGVIYVLRPALVGAGK